MKVSEAVQKLNDLIIEDGFRYGQAECVLALLASHEALRLAGEAVTYRVSAEAIEALEIAVDEASQ